MGKGLKEEAENAKKRVAEIAKELVELEEKEPKLQEEIKTRMMSIPNIIDPSVPIGKDDSENVEVARYGEPVIPDFEIPYHADIIASFNGLDKDAAGRTSGQILTTGLNTQYNIKNNGSPLNFPYGMGYINWTSDGTVTFTSL